MLLLAGAAGAAQFEVALSQKHFPLIESYCLDCHDEETQKGKVNLEALSFKVTTIEQAELWQKVLNAMNAGEMPPENKRQPKNAEKACDLYTKFTKKEYQTVTNLAPHLIENLNLRSIA